VLARFKGVTQLVDFGNEISIAAQNTKGHEANDLLIDQDQNSPLAPLLISHFPKYMLKT
jgi:hypothetical protein